MNKMILNALNAGYSLKDFGYVQVFLNGNATTYYCNNSADIVNTKKGKLKRLKHVLLPNGYNVVTLCYKGKTHRVYVHRLVAKLFIQIPEKYTSKGFTFDNLEVNHKDGIKTNNNATNLEWVTDSDNKIHAYSTGLSKTSEDNALSKYSNEQIHAVCKLIEENKKSPKEISELTKVSVAQILDIRNKGSWLSISNQYDFSKYTPKQQVYTNKQISDVKKYLKDGKKSFKEISDITGMRIKTVYYYNAKLKMAQRLSKGKTE